MTDAQTKLKQWFAQKLETAKHGDQRKLADRLGVRPEAIGRMANLDPSKEMREIDLEYVVKIADFFNEEPPVLYSKLRDVVVSAHVQAGNWTETWEWPDEDKYQISVPADPELVGIRLYAAETRGPSMNKRWAEGTVVVFNSLAETMESPILGKRYVVERRRAGEAEHTVKLLHRDDEGKLWLIPESTDPRFQAPIPIEEGLGEEDEVILLGRVCYAVTKE